MSVETHLILDPALADRSDLAHSWGSTTNAAASWSTGTLHAEARHDGRCSEACPAEPEECSAGLSLAASTLLVAGATDDVVGRDVVLCNVSFDLRHVLIT